MAAGPEQHAGIDAGKLASALDEALEIVRGYADPVGQDTLPVHSPGSLLDQCLQLCKQANPGGPEPIRVLHQFACTGGTLFTKCLAAMPNVQALSEVDPLSTLQLDGTSPHFSPTDLIALMRQSTRGVDDHLLVRIFLEGVSLILEDCTLKGQRLLIRDHAHSHYCRGPGVPVRPTLHGILGSRFSIHAAVTCRHPLDSYLSLAVKSWLSYQPAGLEEYCRRYHLFLDDHANLPLFRYEDFVQAPHQQMRALCSELQLPYSDDFAERFGIYRITGDSGRRGVVIGERRPRPIEDVETLRECAGSRSYATLLERLGYSRRDLRESATDAVWKRFVEEGACK